MCRKSSSLVGLEPMCLCSCKKEITLSNRKMLLFADASILNIFKLSFIHGGSETALEKPESVLLSRSTSEKFFGYENPVGQSIKSSDGTLYQIDGVYEDLPHQTHFHFDVLFSMEGYEHSKKHCLVVEQLL